MSVKTILVHLANDDHHGVRLDVAVRMAKVHRAHIVALFITTPEGMPAVSTGRGASAAYLEAARESARERAIALEEEFESACDKHNVKSTWVVEDGDHLESLAYHAHAADIAILSRPSKAEHLEDHFRMRLAEQFTLISGCPVLLLPRIEEIPTFGKHIMVAWKANREALRAVRDSLPFLKEADKVTVLAVGPTAEDALSETELVSYLSRHEISAEPHNVAESEEGVGHTILATAEALGCDMIVMGAYGHSRIREIIMGGVTRYIFGHTSMPVLLSH